MVRMTFEVIESLDIAHRNKFYLPGAGFASSVGVSTLVVVVTVLLTYRTVDG